MSVASLVERAWTKKEPLSDVDLAGVADVIFLASIRSGCFEIVPGLSQQDTVRIRSMVVMLERMAVADDLSRMIREMRDPAEWKTLPAQSKLVSSPRQAFKNEIRIRTAGTTKGTSTEYRWGPYFHDVEIAANVRMLSRGHPHLRFDRNFGCWPPELVRVDDRWDLRYDWTRVDSSMGFKLLADAVQSRGWMSINFVTADAAFSTCLELAARGFNSEADIDFAETRSYSFMLSTMRSVFSGCVNDNCRVWDSGLTMRSSRDGSLLPVDGLSDFVLDDDGAIRTLNLWNLASPTVSYSNGDMMRRGRLTRAEYEVVGQDSLEHVGSRMFEAVKGRFQVHRVGSSLSVYLPKGCCVSAREACSLVDPGCEVRESSLPMMRGDARSKFHTFFASSHDGSFGRLG